MLLGAARTMEEKRGAVVARERERDQFPVGMRVLAVDDDPVCLKVLETLLRRCQYHVTTTNQAITALKLLRENRDMFDLVISDVHMPDMDGFKLLELVGLEMDLPVIMLSVNGETKSVMKGITHGACDYLLKPVRIEELRNIWQHVVRRKFSKHEPSNLDVYKDFNKPPSADPCHGHNNQVAGGASEPSGRISRKRKEMHSDEEDEGEENDFQEDDEHSAAKKPRVVWSIELHQKFVAAVNQLGIDKAVPKRILELMNVEKLTRENIASHLQKYRLYLKRLSVEASRQASIVAAFGGRDPSFLHMGAFEGLQSYQPFATCAALPSFNPHGLLSRSTAATFGVPELSPAMTVQTATNNGVISHCAGDANEFQPVGLQENQQANLGQGSAASLGLPQLQQKWIHQETNDLTDVFPGSALANTLSGALQRSIISPLPPQELLDNTQAKVSVQQSIKLPSVSSELIERTLGVSANLQDSSISQQGALPINDGSAVTRHGMDGMKQDHLHQGLSSGSFNHNFGACMPEQTNANVSYLVPQMKTNTMASEDKLKQKNMYDLGIPKLHGGFNSNSCNFDGLLNSMIKAEKDDFSFSENDLGCDFFSLGACI